MNASGGPQNEQGREEEQERRFEELDLVRRQLEATTRNMRKLGLEPSVGLILTLIRHIDESSCRHCITVYFGD